jgi:hypothetical protein
VEVGAVDDDVLLSVHGVQLKRSRLGEEVDLALQGLLDVVVGLGTVVAVVRIVE